MYIYAFSAKPKFVGLFLLILLCLVTGVAGQKKTGKRLTQIKRENKAIGFYNQGVKCPGLDHQCKIENYTKAVIANPRYAAAFYNRGFVHQEIADEYKNDKQRYKDAKNEYLLALADYNKAEMLNYRSVTLFYNRGIIYIGETGEYDKGIKDMNIVLKMNPKYLDAYTNRGAAYYFKGDKDRAFPDFQKEVELFPENAKGYNNVGQYYYDKGEYQIALEWFDKAIKLETNPGLLIGYYDYRADTYDKLGEKEKAEVDRKKAQELKDK